MSEPPAPTPPRAADDGGGANTVDATVDASPSPSARAIVAADDDDGTARATEWDAFVQRYAPSTPRGYALCALAAVMLNPMFQSSSSDASSSTSSFVAGVVAGAAATVAVQFGLVVRAVRATASASERRETADADARKDFDAHGASSETEDATATTTGRDAKTTTPYSGWLVVGEPNVKVKSAMTSGVKRFGRLMPNGELRLSVERGGEVVDVVDLRGCEVALTKYPGLEQPTELRWHRSTPVVVRHPSRDVYGGSRVVWLFALSSPAKEAWFVAMMTCVERLNAEARAGESADAVRALDGMRLESEAFAAFTQATKAYRDESMRRDAGASGSHAGMAGATINALGSRLLFDMFRDERWQREQTEKLVNKLNNAPGTPKFVGAFEITHIDFGSNVPHVISARVPNFTSSSAPWDGAAMPGRGYSHALELDVEYIGRATMTVQTRVDLSKYAQDIEIEANKASEAGERASADELMRHLSSFKKVAAREAAKVVASLSDVVSATPLRFTLTLHKCQGVLRLWIPPPPGDRLWWGLIGKPDVELEIIPELGDAAISHEGIAARVSQFLRKLFVDEMHSQLLLPNCVAEPWKELRPFERATELTLAEALVPLGSTPVEAAAEPTVSLPTSPERTDASTLARGMENVLPTTPPPPVSTKRVDEVDRRVSFDAPKSQIMESPVSSPPARRDEHSPSASASASLPSSPTSSILGFGTGFTLPPRTAPPRQSAAPSGGAGFFERAKQLERSIADDFKDFTNAVKDRGIVGGVTHVSKNIEKLASASARASSDVQDGENVDA